MSTFDLITELCSSLAEVEISEKREKKFVQRLRSRAYEVILNSRNENVADSVENHPSSLLASVLWHVYCREKVKGQWTKDIMEDIICTLDKAEILAESNPSFQSVLKLLLSLANISADSVVDQDLSHSLDMKIKISDHTFKHKPLIQLHSAYNPAIFEPPIAVSSENMNSLQVFCGKPGTGLTHQQFFIPSSWSTVVESKKFEEDVENGNWFHSKLNNMAIPVRHTFADPRSCIHQDEGYVTPDQDLVDNQDEDYIPWENMDKEYKLVYSWESFGSAVDMKEPQFILQQGSSVDPISKMVHASDIMVSRGPKTELTALKTVSVEELEVAFKNLLVGVESAVFQFDKEKESFVLRKGLSLNGITANSMEEYCEDFIECGNRFWQLSKITKSSEESGLIFQMLCNNMSHYLQCYRGVVVLKMPAIRNLLETRDWLYRLSTQMQFLISLCPVDSEHKSKDLLLFLCDKMPVMYRHDLSYAYYYILQSCFTLYFTFLSKWIFEGVTNSMWEKEFFIRCNPLTEDMYNRKFWEKGFELDKELVPNCFKGLEKQLLLCGKTMALLNLCASEDPVCKLVKREHPDITCCFNRTDLDKLEIKFDSYKEKYKTHCNELFGNTTPEVHDENYYARLMAKTLDTIKDRIEGERLLKAEKKQFEFNLLKKEMEDAKARKVEEKNALLKKEKELMEEAEKVDQLNDLRRQEEREKIMKFYSSLSESADRRRERAEWRMKRAELFDKRCAFLEKDKKLLEENIEQKKGKILRDEESLEKYLRTYSPIPGSGDFVPIEIESEKPLQNATLSSVPRTEQDMHSERLLVEGSLEAEEAKSLIGDHREQTVESNKREWLIALDVAEKARQSALKFKQRNMNNDYNIITGEETTFEDKFGARSTQGDEETTAFEDKFGRNTQEAKEESFPSIVNLVNSSDDRKELDSSKNVQTVKNSVLTSDNPCDEIDSNEVIEVKTVDGHIGFNEPSMHHADMPEEQPARGLDEIEVDTSEPMIVLNTSDQSETKSPDEIDMAAIYQNVKRSVMIPLFTQLELASDAVVRLFNKHNLLKHMECIWKHFFLLEGEFARNITASLFKEAQKVQHPSYLLNVMKLNSLLRCAVGTNVDEEYTERLSFFVKEIPSVFRTLDPGMLDCLSLRYKTHWPINIIITDELIAKQDVIFKHLLKLHRMAHALEETIYLLKDKRLIKSEEYRKVQLYRHIMTNFITVIKQYITAVAVEKTWNEFKTKFLNATSVDMMYHTYQYYIRKVSSRSLEKVRAHLEHLFNDLFKQILIFYEALRSGEWIQTSTTDCFQHSNFSRISHAFESFKRMADHLVYVFSKMAEVYTDIEQLYAALTWNGFYVVKKRDHSL